VTASCCDVGAVSAVASGPSSPRKLPTADCFVRVSEWRHRRWSIGTEALAESFAPRS